MSIADDATTDPVLKETFDSTTQHAPQSTISNTTTTTQPQPEQSSTDNSNPTTTTITANGEDLQNNQDKVTSSTTTTVDGDIVDFKESKEENKQPDNSSLSAANVLNHNKLIHC
ncbi:unnamed protein product [Ambrosiozyma monospora]|uniref:Unnamed protein product n=1 Tax=Ambrosiozyma monospora TaxID=43982 RepID=A0ACB5U947_AMBMO|nr:unnamed protein product [Ambrosiozyma monospora]